MELTDSSIYEKYKVLIRRKLLLAVGSRGEGFRNAWAGFWRMDTIFQSEAGVGGDVGDTRRASREPNVLGQNCWWHIPLDNWGAPTFPSSSTLSPSQPAVRPWNCGLKVPPRKCHKRTLAAAQRDGMRSPWRSPAGDPRSAEVYHCPKLQSEVFLPHQRPEIPLTHSNYLPPWGRRKGRDKAEYILFIGFIYSPDT